MGELTEAITGCAERAHNTMGPGFLESAYGKCRLVAFRKTGLGAEAQKAIEVRYDREVVGEFVADLLVGGEVIVEPKAVRQLAPVHEGQRVAYLVPTGKPVGLLRNFGEHRVDVKRKVRELLPGESIL